MANCSAIEAQRQRREEGQASNDHRRADQQADELQPVHRQRSGGGRDETFGRWCTGDAKHLDDTADTSMNVATAPAKAAASSASIRKSNPALSFQSSNTCSGAGSAENFRGDSLLHPHVGDVPQTDYGHNYKNTKIAAKKIVPISSNCDSRAPHPHFERSGLPPCQCERLE
jgi:hypothetical protein